MGKMFVTTFLVSAVLVFCVYKIGGFEVAALFSICWLVAVIATTSVGLENIIAKELSVLRKELKGYLLDMYAEMIKKK